MGTITYIQDYLQRRAIKEALLRDYDATVDELVDDIERELNEYARQILMETK